MSKQMERTEEAQINHEPGGPLHYELHVSASSLSEWGALHCGCNPVYDFQGLR